MGIRSKQNYKISVFRKLEKRAVPGRGRDQLGVGSALRIEEVG